MKNFLLVLVLVILVAGGYWWYTKAYPANSAMYPASTPATITEAVTPSVGAAVMTATPAATGPIKEFTVSLSEFAFEPKTLTVNKGDTVNIAFTNSGKYPHDFIITELNVVGKTVPPGKSDTITFTADKTGSFEYYCGIGIHKEKGMTGTLIVK